MAAALDIDFFNDRNWWGNVERGDPSECWPWKKSTGSHGYGQTWDGRTVRVAHRVAWVLHHGTQIPDELVIDHICHNRPCCNPNHLRLLTRSQNASIQWITARFGECRFCGRSCNTRGLSAHERTHERTPNTTEGNEG